MEPEGKKKGPKRKRERESEYRGSEGKDGRGLPDRCGKREPLTLETSEPAEFPTNLCNLTRSDKGRGKEKRINKQKIRLQTKAKKKSLSFALAYIIL